MNRLGRASGFRKIVVEQCSTLIIHVWQEWRQVAHRTCNGREARKYGQMNVNLFGTNNVNLPLLVD